MSGYCPGHLCECFPRAGFQVATMVGDAGRAYM